MTPRADVCSKQLIKRAAAAPEDKRVPNIITGQTGSAALCPPPFVGMISDIRVKRTQFGTSVSVFCVTSVFLTLLFFFLVICNFRSPICQALVLEIGETVQILEKSEGETGSAAQRADIFSCAAFCKGIFLVSAVVGAFYPKANNISL